MSVTEGASGPISPGADGVVVFDIGGVLVDVDAEACPKYLADAVGRDPAEVAKAVYDSGLYDRFDTGELIAADLWWELRALLEAPQLTSEHVFNAWHAGIKSVCPVLGPVAARLAAARRLAYASNNNPIHYPEVLKRLSAAGISDEVPALLSFQAGVRKPDPEFYLLLRDALPGPYSVFIDDRMENVIAAERAGIAAYHHSDPRKTLEMLVRLGVLGAEDGGAR